MDNISSSHVYNKPDFSSVKVNVITPKVNETNTTQIPQNNSNKDKLSINNSTKTNVSTSLEFIDSSKPSKTKVVNGTKFEYYDSSIKNAEELRNKLKPFNINVNGVFNDFDSANKTNDRIREISGKNVMLHHNQTHGVSDLVEAVSQLLDNESLSTLSKYTNSIDSKSPNHIKSYNPLSLKSHIETFFRGLEIKNEQTEEQKLASVIYTAIKMDRAPSIMAHSQGSAITADALNIVRKRLLEDTKNLAETERKMATVSVLTIGGFASRNDYPDEVSLVKIENTMLNNKGRDAVPFIANNGMSKTRNVQQLEYASDVVNKHIEVDPKRNRLEKAFLHTAIDTSVGLTIGIEKTKKVVLGLSNASMSIIPTIVNSVKNKGALEEHLALGGYIDKKEVEDEIKNFFDR